MPVQITINGADATESIRELTVLAAAISGQAVVAQPATAPQPQKTEAQKQQRTTKPESVNPPAPEPAASEKPEPEKTSGSSADDSPEDQGGEDQEEIPTVVQLRAAAQEKGKTAEGKAAIKDLLNKYGSKSISDVPEKRRAAFLKELEAL